MMKANTLGQAWSAQGRGVSLVGPVIAIILIAYGFFGSLGHGLAVLALLVFGALNPKACARCFQHHPTVLAYVSLSAIVYWSFLRSSFSGPVSHNLEALSPMVPLAVLGLWLVLGQAMRMSFNAQWVGRVASLSILVVYGIGILLNYVPQDSVLAPYAFDRQPRLVMMSGNPIPFSTIVMGLGALTLTGFHSVSIWERAVTLFCFALSLYAAIMLSGTRGQVAVLLLLVPITLWHVTQSWRWAGWGVCVSLAVFVCAIYAQAQGLINVRILKEIWLGVETLYTGEGRSKSDTLRLDMWQANIAAIQEAPLFGYGISERFEALRPHLSRDFTFSHGHNDILNAAVVGGVVGGLLAILAFCSPVVAWILCVRASKTALYMALASSVVLGVNANLNTVFFNDIMSSWLAFATFLVVALGRSEISKSDADQRG